MTDSYSGWALGTVQPAIIIVSAMNVANTSDLHQQ